MAVLNIKSYIGVEDYIAGERESSVRHEYVDGQVYAMAGASDRHNRIAGNTYSRLLNHLDDNKCEPFMSDMKVKVDPVLYYYPDVVVTCDDSPTDRYTREHPVLVVEVTSSSTERIDRHEKLIAYKLVPSMREYVLVSQDGFLIKVHRHTDEAQEWTREILTNTNEELRLASVNLTLSVKDVYRNVRFDDSSSIEQIVD